MRFRRYDFLRFVFGGVFRAYILFYALEKMLMDRQDNGEEDGFHSLFLLGMFEFIPDFVVFCFGNKMEMDLHKDLTLFFELFVGMTISNSTIATHALAT